MPPPETTSPDEPSRGRPPRALLVLGHGREDSLCHALFRAAHEALEAAGAEVRSHDLFADGFDPVLRLPPGARHALPEHSGPLARRYQEDVRWMDALVVVHPVWWFGPPAILKGWVDQVLVHSVAIEQTPEGPPKPLLGGRRALVVQTFNAARIVDRILMRGMAEGFWRRAVFLSTGIALAGSVALYGVEGISPEAVEAARRKVARAVRKML
ncbi:MAG: NAD(P)H-dependent oxidoreductase [Planctomycetes bacterium]|nr:NAD(P)H-dependent oxidoreductase [Planctomycetota bacterium]